MKVVGGQQRLAGRVWQLDGVAPRQLEAQFRLQCSLEMDVQFGLRHALDEIAHELSLNRVNHGANAMPTDRTYLGRASAA